MAFVLLNRVWLHDAVNLGDNVAFRAQELDEEQDTSGQVRMYAGGRTRSVQPTGVRQTIILRARFLDRADVDRLRGWVGRKLMLRDTRGRKVFGVFHSVRIEEWVPRDRATVRFSFVEVFHDEAV